MSGATSGATKWRHEWLNEFLSIGREYHKNSGLLDEAHEIIAFEGHIVI